MEIKEVRKSESVIEEVDTEEIDHDELFDGLESMSD